jgi:hypothetical protein
MLQFQIPIQVLLEFLLTRHGPENGKINSFVSPEHPQGGKGFTGHNNGFAASPTKPSKRDFEDNADDILQTLVDLFVEHGMKDYTAVYDFHEGPLDGQEIQITIKRK